MSPFKKVTGGKDKGKYRSPSGKTYTAKQVRLYHLTEGFTKMRKAKRIKKR